MIIYYWKEPKNNCFSR